MSLKWTRWRLPGPRQDPPKSFKIIVGLMFGACVLMWAFIFWAAYH
jgi:hypothetical protein